MADPIRILHIIDNNDGGDATLASFEEETERFSVVAESNVDTGLYRLSDMTIDVVVCTNIADTNQSDLLSRIRSQSALVPVVILRDEDTDSSVGQFSNDELVEIIDKDRTRISDISTSIINIVERRRAQKARKETEDRYWQLVETAPGPIFIFSEETRLKYINAAGMEFLGVTDRDQVIDNPAVDLVHPDDESLLVDRFNRVLRDEESVESTELRLITMNGEVQHVMLSSAPIMYEGTPAIQTVGTDISSLKDRERELMRHQTITETMPDIVYTLDIDGCITSLNADQLPTGHSRDELIGEHVSAIMSSDDVETGNTRIRELIRNPDRSKATFEMNLISDNGEALPYENHISLLPPDEDDRFRGTIGVLRDISDRIAREQELQRERDRFATLFENLPNPSVHLHLNEGQPVVNTVNPAYEEVFGVEEDAIRNQPLQDLLNPAEDDSEIAQIDIDSIEDDTIRREVSRKTPNGYRDFLLHLASKELDGTIEGYAIYTDITEQKAREAELARQNERLDRFASLLSHDLRNPLTVAMGRLQMLQSEVDNEQLDQLEDSLKRIEQLIGDVMTMAREGEAVGDTTTVSLEELIQRSGTNVEVDGIDLKVESDLRFQANPGRLQQVFENFLRNSVDHAGPSPRIRIGPLEHGDGFYFEDDGPGIPPADRERAFEPGYSSDSGGTGLGLNIVNEIVEAHGWTVSVVEGDMGGARFEIEGVQFTDD